MKAVKFVALKKQNFYNQTSYVVITPFDCEGGAHSITTQFILIDSWRVITGPSQGSKRIKSILCNMFGDTPA